ncbi:polysaccharide pyruvyl transferase family protein [Tuwongella immobilis]|uniref:Polysaccharide pyruvyl transferase domain-containing protein n=1 Tax=Tuwongella immobilis TaxID=692036 RepID=A0A6C2YJM1_9BACT|nr:polysaccharide pyruvyl transferase family protein [Tuwongella immobilis]VIP01481.1 Polysaccharide pyruvyl transferase OS=Singulisphaera acidiphila (strain ATCC BAA-1392 / DSM 18658 / VKM B-2454 / MOB10) GN=Sinac_4469 PE=4 SV=1: PS_pyruv_trans [Tuwongella immobilis]VTR98535.1 Polysaccharide pyruvyl transferase OS=Singulisphaera acidiphila (strain ATCC BAA-1392 / DSM 18658 / VKM B-2454 / MOB10) GN=Sinac_4469 PE=4 SV=1: PS_pyruv_trans [Tuwongella immobilis]
MQRREFIASVTASVAASATTLVTGTGGFGNPSGAASAEKPKRILLRSSWQTVNIGDIAHTPGMLALLEQHQPQAEVTLWPSPLSAEVETLLLRRFPRLKIAKTPAEQSAALEACDFVLHGSGPGLVGAAAMERARKAGKPYGFGGVTLNDDELKKHRDLLSGAQFLFTRDTDSLRAFRKAEIAGPTSEFGPDATFALDLRDESAADRLLKQHQLDAGKFLVAVPRLRWTPYWEIHPERTKPNPERSAINEAFAERDHAKMRQAIVAWVEQTGMRVLLAPEMTYAVPRLRPLLFDPLPAAIQKQVAVMDRYWLTAEAASVYARAGAVLSFEMHSPIMAISAGVPAIHLRQPTDTRKGQMWRDIGLNAWLFEIDGTTGEPIAAATVAIGRDLPAARKQAAQARRTANDRMAAMVSAIAIPAKSN